MRYEDLSAADQQLLNTDLGEIEKDASEQLALADEMYAVGFSKLAQETADNLDAIMAMDKEASYEDLSMDEGSEKNAFDLGAFIERGFFDGLCKLGAERHGDEMVYLYPFIEEKVAAKASAGALDKVRKFISSKVKAVKGKASEGADWAKGKAGEGADWAKSKAKKGIKAEKEYRHGATGEVKGGYKALKSAVTGVGGNKKHLSGEKRWDKAKAGLKGLGKGVGKLSPYAAVPAGAAYGAKKLYDKKSESSEG